MAKKKAIVEPVIDLGEEVILDIPAPAPKAVKPPCVCASCTYTEAQKPNQIIQQ